MQTALTKKCSKCKTEKLLTAFHKDKSRKDGRYCVCATCEKMRSRNRYKNNKNKYFYWQIKKLYGVTAEQYKDLLLKQDFRCAICGKHQRYLKVKLSIDHNHLTGEIRGLLCHRCNYLLGNIEKFNYLPELLKYMRGGDDYNTDFTL